MGYGLLYDCPFESMGGHQFSIKIYKKDFDGQPVKRHLGASPTLRQDRSGAICGTSLQFNLEAIENDEFHSLYTSDAREYLVELHSLDSKIWRGFISPELYSEPDVPPPFDVALTATDGLGELKNYSFVVPPVYTTISKHLEYCLDLTGLDNMHILAVSTLQDNAAHLTTRDFFQQKMDLSFLEGKNYYDVLVYLLDTINASIRLLDDQNWIIIRDTDLYIDNRGDIMPPAIYIDGNTSGTRNISYGVIGSMRDYDIFPIGFLTNEVIPAHNKVTIVSDNHYKSILANSNMEKDATWTKYYGTTFDTDHYSLPVSTGQISQTIQVDGGYPYSLLLSVDARCKFNSSHDQPQTISFSVRMKSGSTTYYYNPSQSSRDNIAYVNNRHNRANRVLSGNWITGNAVWHNMEINAAYNDSDDDIQTFEYAFQIPRNVSGRGGIEPSEISVFIKNTGTYYDEFIYRVDLVILDQRTGTKTIVKMDNNAREIAEDVSILIPYNASTSHNVSELVMGVPVSPDDKVYASWKSSRFSGREYNELIALDYAQANALPRWKKSGKVNIPDGHYNLPLVYAFDTYPHTSIDPYVIMSYLWDLFNDEAEVELISFPLGNVSIDSIKVVTSTD